METQTLYFSSSGPENTSATLQAAAARARELGLRQVVVATSTGKTALLAAQASPDWKVIAVTLARGLWDKYVGPDPETVREAEAKGVAFLTCPHALMGSVDGAIRDKFGGLPAQQLISYVFYTFSQGTKVAVECLLMAADAGRLDMTQEVIAIAGTEYGADTALVLKPVYSHDFFSLAVREIIAKPR
jgi:hypothetical protein